MQSAESIVAILRVHKLNRSGGEIWYAADMLQLFWALCHRYCGLSVVATIWLTNAAAIWSILMLCLLSVKVLDAPDTMYRRIRAIT